MRKHVKRLFAAAMCFSMLHAALPVPSASADIIAETGAESTAAAAAGISYLNNASFAAKIADITRNGNCCLYADTQRTPTGQNLTLGSSLDNSYKYYVVTASGASWNGKQCYIYAQGVYGALFDELPLNGNSALKHSETVISGADTLNASVLKAAKVMPGAYIRTTADTTGYTFNGSAGHSMILLGYDENTVTILEGNANGNGLISLTTKSYSDFDRYYTAGKGRVICHVIQPTASRYLELYGMTYDGSAINPAAAVTTPVSSSAATTATTSATTTKLTTTTSTSTTKPTTTTTTSTSATKPTTTTTTSATKLTTTTATTASETEAVTETTAPEIQTFYSDDIYIHRTGIDVPLYLALRDGIIWESSNPEVASVKEPGLITVRNNGFAMVTADAGFAKFCFLINVNAIAWEELGDINHDSITDAADATLILQDYVSRLAGKDDGSALSRLQTLYGDVDDDGAITVADAQFVLQFYATKVLSKSEKTEAEVWQKILG